MKVDTLVDFSFPYMQARHALQKMHEAMIDKKFVEAREAALEAITETKLALNAISVEEEKWK